jgi:hypothetical protein
LILDTADSGLSPELRKVQTTVISSSGDNGQCQQLWGNGPFSGEKVICGDGSTGNRFCYVIYPKMKTLLHFPDISPFTKGR